MVSAGTIDISNAPATCYTIRNGWSWAHIFMRHGMGETNDGHARGWVHVSVISDFGSFGYCWSHTGNTPGPKFLGELSFDYAMRKMFGQAYDVPLCVDDMAKKVREIVLDARRQGSMPKDDARSLWDALPYCEDQATFLRDLDDHSGGAMYRHELYDDRWTEPNPQARGFWADIWPHFLEALGARAPASADTRPEGGDSLLAPFTSGAVPKAGAQTPPLPPSQG